MTTNTTEMPSKEVKYEDMVEFFNKFASEFNNDRLHDRVLVFEIIEQSHDSQELSAEEREPKGPKPFDSGM